MEGVALLDEQQAEQLVHPAVLLHPEDGPLLLRGKVQPGVKGARHQIRLDLAALGGQHPHTSRQVIVYLHEPHGDEAVEPGIRRLLHDVSVGGIVAAVRGEAADGLRQAPPLPDRRRTADDIGRRGADVVELRGGVGLGQRVLNSPLRDPHQPGPVAHIGDEPAPGPDGKIFNGGLIHGQNSTFKISCSASSAVNTRRSSASAWSMSSGLSSRQEAVRATLLMVTFLVLRA